MGSKPKTPKAEKLSPQQMEKLEKDFKKLTKKYDKQSKQQLNLLQRQQEQVREQGAISREAARTQNQLQKEALSQQASQFEQYRNFITQQEAERAKIAQQQLLDQRTLQMNQQAVQQQGNRLITAYNENLQSDTTSSLRKQQAQKAYETKSLISLLARRM